MFEPPDSLSSKLMLLERAVAFDGDLHMHLSRPRRRLANYLSALKQSLLIIDLMMNQSSCPEHTPKGDNFTGCDVGRFSGIAAQDFCVSSETKIIAKRLQRKAGIEAI